MIKTSKEISTNLPYADLKKETSKNPGQLALETLTAIAIGVIFSEIQCSSRSSCPGMYLKNVS